MTIEQTEHQSREQLQDAKLKSLEPPVSPAELPGYQLIQHLGSGAFGQVWLALDQTTGRKVAIKFYNRRSVGDVNALAREVQKLATLAADRHVVQLLDVGWESDPPFYVMDYIDRGSLEDRLRREKSLPVSEAVEIFQDVATGLLNLHGKGILHCDLKPGNVLLDDDHKPRLADFGQARLSDEAVPSLGTLYYMAPEQADLKAVPDARWDVYALGALLYVMLTGRPPYHEETLSGLMESTNDLQHRLDTYRNGIIRSKPPQGHRKVPGVDRQLADIIDRCVAADPRKRFPNIQSVLFALKQRQEWISRRPLLLLGLLGPLLLLGIVGLAGWSAYRRAVVDSDSAITLKAAQSNHFAAQLAARSAAEQMDEYFRAVTDLAGDVAFQMDLKAAVNDREFEELRLQLSDPNRNSDPELGPIRQRFLQHPARVPLDNKLTKLRASKNLQQVASWWVYDPYGNQLAAAFAGATPSDQLKTVGRNYSYRSYFTGLNDDLLEKQENGRVRYPVSPDPRNRQHVMLTHLSAVFLSEASNTWKIAFSAPVLIEVDGKVECLGVVGLTVEMGDFVDFTATPGQYAIMYDQRPGKNQGLVLEHPLFDAFHDRGEKLPESLASCRVDPMALIERPTGDPVGQIDLGTDYAGRYITGLSDVEFSDLELHQQNARRKSGLVVVVFEDYETILEPSHELGRKLLNLGLIAASIALAVAILMWLMAARMLRQTGRRLAKAFGPGDEGTRGTGEPSAALAQVSAATGKRAVTEPAADAARQENPDAIHLNPTEAFERPN
ncbi:MAG: protein kinase domain-containing protein [Planctomycetota bacterium]